MPWWTVPSIVLAALGLYLFLSHLVYRRFIRVGSANGGGLVDQTDPFFRSSWEWFKTVARDTVAIRAFDGTRLSAAYVAPAVGDPGRTAILVHGYRSVGSDLAILARLYSDMGFRVLVPDLRAHGLSGGNYTSFGHFERYDLRRWIDFVLRTYGANEKILVHGVSLGASTAFLYAAGDVSPNLRLIVADSPFASVWGVFARTVRPRALVLFLPGIEFWCRYLHRFLLFRIDVPKAVKATRTPFLIIHSVGDRVTPYAASERMSALSEAPHEVHAVHSDVHAEGYRTDKAGIDAKIAAFVAKTFEDKKK
ncbi:MAG: alpha/beta fold hydrolase [Candidatus Izemoplasmatales bacterium]